MRAGAVLLAVVCALGGSAARAQPAPPAPAPVAIDAPANAAPAAVPADVDAAPAPADAAPAAPVTPPPTPTPPVTPPPSVAPSVTPPAATPTPAPPHVAHRPAERTADRTLFAIKVIAGLVVLLVLAYLGGHRTVLRFQEKLGLSNVAAIGFPFVALGLIAASDSVGVLTGSVLDSLRPLLRFGLGWLGFIIGAQLDIRVLDRVPKGTAYLMLVEALAPFAATAAACGGLMLTFGASPRDPLFWRDMILLGTAAAMTAPRMFRGFASRTWREGQGVDALLGQLDEVVGIVGLLFMTAYFRTSGGAWLLPDTAWLFVSIGIGVIIGVLIFAMLRVPVSNAEFLAVVLGAIAFGSGLAGYLKLSPTVICFVAGVLVVNFPCEQRASVFRILGHLERPVHLLFLIILGAVWAASDWRGWALVPFFIAARIAGKWLGVLGARASIGALLPSGFADERLKVSPMSSLAIALVVNVQSLSTSAGASDRLAWIVTAVIGGAIGTEIVIQLLHGREPGAPPPTRPIDELDGDESGPTYAADLEADR